MQRGTKIVNEPLKTSAWNGQEFRSQEEKRMTLSGLLEIISARGTKKTGMNKMSGIKIPRIQGRFITTSRGTTRTKM